MLNFKALHVTYANPHNINDEITVDYKLRETSIARKWANRVLLAHRLGYQIDNPERFYGFGSIESQIDHAVTSINAVVDILENKFKLKIGKRLSQVTDQDTLNFLHHVFEIEHGLLDSKQSSAELQKYLCQLNILVHYCESISRGANPRHVVTYFGLPKTEILEESDYQYFETTIKFGTVYINYVEIGKTLYDLMMDNDSYIDPSAFQPFKHFSADFVVHFWNGTQQNLVQDLEIFYTKHKEFFNKLGYTWEFLFKSIGSIPVADLESSLDVLASIETRQFVKAVHFS